MPTRLAVLFAAVSLALAGCAPTPDVVDAPPAAVFEEAPCPMPVPEGVVEGETLRCGYVTVPELHVKGVEGEVPGEGVCRKRVR